ncbi:MAG TPA: GGDEF domain-containing protein [Steroidobacteraceae bacterium]|nr:GGDEF domain-containing protein [Steroidobacteraceae bacterium]
MDTLRHRGRAAASTAALLAWAAISAAAWLLSWPAHADCLASPYAAVRALQSLAATDAVQASRRARSMLAPLLRAPNADPRRIASLYAVIAQSDSRLELDVDARAAARSGLRLVGGASDPVRLDLLAAYAENVYDEAGMHKALQSIVAARSAQPPRSAADICLRITEGLLQYRLNQEDRAIVSLSEAYRAASSQGLAEPRMLAADSLTAVMRAMRDYPQALTLNDEVIAWDLAHDATLSLSVSRYVRGTILKLMGNYRGAIAEFTQSRALSVPLHDVQGIAFEDLRICETRVELKQWTAAERECRGALATFTAAGSTDVVKEARAVLALIDLDQGHPARARAALNGVLARGGADVPPRRVAAFYQWRARADAALGDYGAAYRDLGEYVRRTAVETDAERISLAAAMRARFATDREIERNVSLRRKLALSMERSRRQAEELNLIVIASLSALLLIVLLIYILTANLRHRRALQRLAAEDALTGLPNRRATFERASAAFDLALAAHAPLTIAIIDLDHFKLINDRCGHAAGDQVLREFALAGAAALRATDVLGRWGGEEFLLVMPDTPLETAVGTLERLRTLLCKIRLPAVGADLRVSLSAGLATMDEKVKSPDELIARADTALYEAKGRGRDLLRVAEESYLTASTGARRALRQ